MASIFKRGPNKKNRKSPWLIQYSDGNGKRPVVTGFPDRALTEQLAAKIEQEVRLRKKGMFDPVDEDEPKERRPIEGYLGEFRTSISRPGVTEKHVGLTLTRITRITVEARFETPGEIDFDSVEAILREIAEADDLSHKTYNHYLQAFDQFCRWLSDGRRQVLPRNPIAGMPRLNTKLDVRRIRRALSPKEIGMLVESALKSGVDIQCYSGLDRAKIYLISYFTGLRRNEIGSLTPSSFDLSSAQRTFTIEAQAAKNRTFACLPLHDDLAAFLTSWLNGIPPNQILFPKLGKRRTWLMVKKDLERVGIPYRTSDGTADFHAVGRYSHITGLVSNGANLAHAQSLARHSDIRTTIDYTRIPAKEQAETLATLPSPTGISQQFLQQLNGSDCLSVSSDGGEATQHGKPNNAKEPENDDDCLTMAGVGAESPIEDSGFDPRRLHFCHELTLRARNHSKE